MHHINQICRYCRSKQTDAFQIIKGRFVYDLCIHHLYPVWLILAVQIINCIPDLRFQTKILTDIYITIAVISLNSIDRCLNQTDNQKHIGYDPFPHTLRQCEADHAYCVYCYKDLCP